MNFHTGAYWKGYEDRLDGLLPRPPVEYGEQGLKDYMEGYNATTALTDEEIQEVCDILNKHARGEG
jgi:hypothetical protein